MDKMTLSIIVASHQEGLIAHKTMLSIYRATKKLRELGIRHEIIITIDKGDDSTINYFSRYLKDKDISVNLVSFGDLAMSRNYGVSISKGKYIATVDADDLVSENWFVEAVKKLENTKGNVVLHTEYSINFGTKDIIWHKSNSRAKEEDAIIMTWANRWDSAIVAPREVLESFPYQPNTNGYGSEDWHFNSETLASSIPHMVVPGTILFVRRKEVSEMTTQATDCRTVRYTKLLDFEFIKNIDLSKYKIQNTKNTKTSHKYKSIARKVAFYIHNKSKSNKLYANFYSKTISLYIKRNQNQNRFPSWLTDEWHSIHSIEKSTFPSQKLLETIPIYKSEIYELGLALSEITSYITKKPDYIMFIPYMAKGGAELVALNYIKTIQKIHPNWRILVVSTLASNNPWKHMIPSEVDFVPFGNIVQQFSEQLQLDLLARFIVQSGAKKLHVSQSALLYRFISSHKKLLEPYTIYSFAFCDDIDSEGRIGGHVHSGIPYAYDSINRIITDNLNIVNELVSQYGYDETRFSVHYQPVELSIMEARPRKKSDIKLRILWASRISKQKRPDILVSIAEKLENDKFNIDVYGSFQDGYSADMLNIANKITYRGEFSGIDSIPTENYDIFLYTSENDGVPNILLEATAKGLAIIAPHVGGISEFISKDTGILIDDKEDIGSYISAIKRLSNDEKLRLELIKNAQIKLKKQHSVKRFNRIVAKDII